MKLPVKRRTVRTLAEMLRRLGNVPTHRILWQPFPGTASEADVIALRHGSTKQLAELVDGILVEKTMGRQESFMAATLIQLLMNFVVDRNLGLVGSPDFMTRVLPHQIRFPDVSFTSWESLPSDDAHLQPVADYTPELCIEVLSLPNTRREMAR